MTKPLLLTADFGLELAEGEDSPRKFSGLLYSGGLVPGFNAVIDLDSTTVDEPMSLLHEHRRDTVIGTINSAKVKGYRLPVAGEIFSDIDEKAAEIAAKAKRGARYQMSAGIFGFTEEAIAPGQKVRVNGKSFVGPISVLRGGRIREGSVVTLGADPNTAVSFFSQSGDAPMPDEKRIADLEAAVTNLTAQLEAATRRADEAEAKLLAEAKAKRADEIKALFAETGKEFSDDAAAPFAEMSDAAFAAAASALRALAAASKREPNSALFSEQATGGSAASEEGGEISITSIYARRNQAAAK